MEERKGYHCPVEATLDLIGGKYKTLILWHLAGGPQRFSQLQRLISRATPKMLTQQLRELEEDGVIHREVFPVVPPRVEYSVFADVGVSVIAILNAMRDWGTDYLHEQNLEPNCSMTGEVCCCEKNRS